MGNGINSNPKLFFNDPLSSNKKYKTVRHFDINIVID